VNEQDGSITYSADPGSAGTDQLTYVVNDGTVDSAVATVTITIFPILVLDPDAIDASEAGSNADDFTVSLRTAVPVRIEVTFATSQRDADSASLGSDYREYDASERPLVIEPGVSVVSQGPPAIIDDTEDEPEETFSVEFTAHYPGNVSSTATGIVTIVRDGRDEIVD
jgi:hypothetical protein